MCCTRDANICGLASNSVHDFWPIGTEISENCILVPTIKAAVRPNVSEVPVGRQWKGIVIFLLNDTVVAHCLRLGVPVGPLSKTFTLSALGCRIIADPALGPQLPNKLDYMKKRKNKIHFAVMHMREIKASSCFCRINFERGTVCL